MVLHAFMECSDQVQADIRELVKLLNDPTIDSDDRYSICLTLADALFPNPHKGKLGIDLEESERLGAEASDEMRQAVAELDQEEATFSERLGNEMKQRGISQEALAEMVGIGQPAISNILNRKSRPQRRTVVKFADALGVSPEDLWPGLTSQ